MFIFLCVLGKFYSFTVYMVCVNSIVNPFVYAIQYHEFQNRTREIFCVGKNQPKELSVASTKSTDISIIKQIS